MGTGFGSLGDTGDPIAADEAGVAKKVVQAAVDAVFDTIAATLARGDDISVTGFGRIART